MYRQILMCRFPFTNFHEVWSHEVIWGSSRDQNSDNFVWNKIPNSLLTGGLILYHLLPWKCIVPFICLFYFGPNISGHKQSLSANLYTDILCFKSSSRKSFDSVCQQSFLNKLMNPPAFHVGQSLNWGNCRQWSKQVRSLKKKSDWNWSLVLQCSNKLMHDSFEFSVFDHHWES